MTDLVASKLIRYDEIDRSDVQYLVAQSRPAFSDIEAAAKRLPAPFARDPLVLENLENLRADMEMWGYQTMTSRERLQYSYELAFYPPRLNEVWYQVKNKTVSNLDELGEMLDTALLLNGALPSDGYASQHALNRLALYQAKSRAFHTVSFLRNIRKALGRGSLSETEVPGSLVRDIGLPRLCRT